MKAPFAYIVPLIFASCVITRIGNFDEKPRPTEVIVQQELNKHFRDCAVTGSIAIYNMKSKRWITNDTLDIYSEALPASTFKIVNLLIALETGAINNEEEVIKWNGDSDTTLYGYRPDIYRDMTVKEAFDVSAVWVFIELAKRVGKEKYKHYLKLANYGNNNFSEPGDDFWNFGKFAVSPVNQVQFLKKLYEGKLPFLKKI